MSARGKQPKVGDTVLLLDGTDAPAIEGTVGDLLSEQFTVVHERRRSDGGYRELVSYRFYRDHGVTWK